MSQRQAEERPSSGRSARVPGVRRPGTPSLRRATSTRPQLALYEHEAPEPVPADHAPATKGRSKGAGRTGVPGCAGSGCARPPGRALRPALRPPCAHRRLRRVQVQPGSGPNADQVPPDASAQQQPRQRQQAGGAPSRQNTCRRPDREVWVPCTGPLRPGTHPRATFSLRRPGSSERTENPVQPQSLPFSSRVACAASCAPLGCCGRGNRRCGRARGSRAPCRDFLAQCLDPRCPGGFRRRVVGARGLCGRLLHGQPHHPGAPGRGPHHGRRGDLSLFAPRGHLPGSSRAGPAAHHRAGRARLAGAAADLRCRPPRAAPTGPRAACRASSGSRPKRGRWAAPARGDPRPSVAADPRRRGPPRGRTAPSAPAGRDRPRARRHTRSQSRGGVRQPSLSLGQEPGFVVTARGFVDLDAGWWIRRGATRPRSRGPLRPLHSRRACATRSTGSRLGARSRPSSRAVSWRDPLASRATPPGRHGLGRGRRVGPTPGRLASRPRRRGGRTGSPRCRGLRRGQHRTEPGMSRLTRVRGAGRGPVLRRFLHALAPGTARRASRPALDGSSSRSAPCVGLTVSKLTVGERDRPSSWAPLPCGVSSMHLLTTHRALLRWSSTPSS